MGFRMGKGAGDGAAAWSSGRGVVRLLRQGPAKGGDEMYSILYIIGAIVVIIVLLKLLGLY